MGTTGSSVFIRDGKEEWLIWWDGETGIEEGRTPQSLALSLRSILVSPGHLECESPCSSVRSTPYRGSRQNDKTCRIFSLGNVSASVKFNVLLSLVSRSPKTSLVCTLPQIISHTGHVLVIALRNLPANVCLSRCSGLASLSSLGATPPVFTDVAIDKINAQKEASWTLLFTHRRAVRLACITTFPLFFTT